MSLCFSDVYTDVACAKDRGDLQRAVVHCAKRMGFLTVTAMGVVDRPGEPALFEVVDNTPEAYLPLYTDLEFARRDPVTLHCKRSVLPIAWNQATFVSSGCGSRWEEQACFGYRVGIAFALHLPHGRHFMVGVDRDGDLPSSPDQLSRMAADLQMLAVHAQEAAMLMFFGRRPLEPELPPLSSRELEALRWTMEGKTAWEVGRILSISEQTAVRHLNNATKKLDCVNKHHAVVKALRMGLVR